MDPKTIQPLSAKLCIFNNILNGERQINKVLVTGSAACIYSILNGTLSGCVAGPCRAGLGIAYTRIWCYLSRTGFILCVISPMQPWLALKVTVTFSPRIIPFSVLLPLSEETQQAWNFHFYLFYLLLCNVLWSIFYFHQDCAIDDPALHPSSLFQNITSPPDLPLGWGRFIKGKYGFF